MDKFEVKTEKANWNAYKVGSGAWKIETFIGGVYLNSTTPDNWDEVRVFKLIYQLDSALE